MFVHIYWITNSKYEYIKLVCIEEQMLKFVDKPYGETKNNIDKKANNR